MKMTMTTFFPILESYDVVCIMGGITIGHLTPDVLPELIRMLKPGNLGCPIKEGTEQCTGYSLRYMSLTFKMSCNFSRNYQMRLLLHRFDNMWLDRTIVCFNVSEMFLNSRDSKMCIRKPLISLQTAFFLPG